MDKNKSLLSSFMEHKNQIARLIGRIVRPDEIEDIVQETFVQSYVAAKSQHINNPKAFMFRTARNLALNSINRSEYKLSSSMEVLPEIDLVHDGNMVEEQCLSDEKFRNFCRAVSTLPVQCRKVFILKKVYGLSQKEIADYLNISPSTVEKHIARGMNVTAEYMLNAGYTGIRKGKGSAARPGRNKHVKETAS